MTTPDIPLPSPGDRDWSDWGAEVEELTDEVRDRLSDTALRAVFAPKPGLADTLFNSGRVHFGHRGLNSYPENSVEGLRAAIAAGYPIETDVRALADGTLVICHDATTTRTMTSTAADVAALTVEEWRARSVRPPVTGGRVGTPAELEPLLDEFGGRKVMALEIKANGITDNVIDAITRRGLEREVLVASQDWNTAVAVAGAGIATMLYDDDRPVADLVDNGIEAVGVSTAVTADYIAPALAADIHVVAHGVTDAATAATMFSRGVEGVLTGDPQMVAGHIKPVTSDSFRDGHLWPQATRIASAAAAIELDPLGPGVALRYIGDGSAASSAAIRLGQFGVGPQACRVRFGLRFLAGGTSSDRWAAIWIGTADATEDPFREANTASTVSGTYFLIRRNGKKDMYRRTAGSSAPALLATHTSPTPFAASLTAEGGLFEFEAEVTATSHTLRCLTDGTEATFADSASARPANSMLSLITASTGATFSDIRLAR